MNSIIKECSQISFDPGAAEQRADAVICTKFRTDKPLELLDQIA
jgi:hypothetical protein